MIKLYGRVGRGTRKRMSPDTRSFGCDSLDFCAFGVFGSCPSPPSRWPFILVDRLAATLLDKVRQGRAKLSQSRRRIVRESLSTDV